ncbi:hypothetical protein POSPLADRAFT_1148283 [Postia placenta MAD-698-R-SB12]|uniref:Nodulin-like domain-containing protein n=1 Tax=Postia placenta MAD-698-R-SB12 TaxID=670580 RepID=A0A1X6MWJ1_9APHY|nr:hypothetical protein POSPLADRAFT_1148283 [Postia placenta MAD-698-R-SB12]OSX60721.1 hypothetical protein POSPLADRAFT_1148283 [Postia placenta MAD-698-R-SB12]
MSATTHAHAHAHAPALFSLTRISSFLTCLLVALASGTNYVPYAPQLGSRLGLSHTQLNVIGLSGNIGVYGSAPLWGRIVDTRGPRMLLIMAFCTLIIGYSGIRHYYDRGLIQGTSTLSTFDISVLVLFGFLTGIGGNGGLAGAMNSTAKSWPDRARATANGIVISGFGLSAFLFSTMAHIFFPGNTSDFLLVLAVGTSIPMLLGFFLVRPIPLQHTFSVSRQSLRHPGPAHALGYGVLNISGRALFASADFWLLFTITALLSGTGLMYINNVGSISQALFAKGNPNYDEGKAAQLQASQVSIVSIMNCLGRVSIGMLADFTKSFLKLPRSFCLPLIACIFIISQITCYYVEDVGALWKASALLGAAYGAMFGLFPTIVIEWFGLPHFSENWGFVSLSPMIGSNIFSIAFGRNLDAHAPPSSPCLEGRTCYADSLKLTIAACCVALGLAVYSGWRDRRRQMRIALKGAEIAPEVVWEVAEE